MKLLRQPPPDCIIHLLSLAYSEKGIDSEHPFHCTYTCYIHSILTAVYFVIRKMAIDRLTKYLSQSFYDVFVAHLNGNLRCSIKAYATFTFYDSSYPSYLFHCNHISSISSSTSTKSSNEALETQSSSHISSCGQSLHTSLSITS